MKRRALNLNDGANAMGPLLLAFYVVGLLKRTNSMDKLEKLSFYIADLLSEKSTWQGIAFFLGLFGSHYAALDWGQGAALGASLSGALKIIFKD
jgi:hypothetical protein